VWLNVCEADVLRARYFVFGLGLHNQPWGVPWRQLVDQLGPQVLDQLAQASPYPPHKVNEHVCEEPSKYNRWKCDQCEVDYILWRFRRQIARRNIVQLDAKSESFATGQPPKTTAEVRLRIDDHNA
jgi:hypothetical protein